MVMGDRGSKEAKIFLLVFLKIRAIFLPGSLSKYP